MSTRTAVLTALLIGLFGVAGHPRASAQQPGWSPVVIATGEYRQQIKSLPIERRPNRPFHFYGNAVRRSYYRGSSFDAGIFSGSGVQTRALPFAGGWWAGR